MLHYKDYYEQGILPPGSCKIVGISSWPQAIPFPFLSFTLNLCISFNISIPFPFIFHISWWIRHHHNKIKTRNLELDYLFLSIVSLLKGLHICLWDVNLMVLNSESYNQWVTYSCPWEFGSIWIVSFYMERMWSSWLKIKYRVILYKIIPSEAQYPIHFSICGMRLKNIMRY